ncbi:helix-turn-helix domain-containing protein [Paenibacillus sp. HB172176]|uniref:helix-turn-helix domain-containing protein n=1 Tax=Paenibacillus sp. HB172176 TaxID=2493690 RepID=UPI0014397A9F|nr:helix-turn-helix domain-containing protein [Paenibacillus sp. HB172176]
MREGMKQWYTITDLCEIFPIGRNAIYRLVNEEGFPKIRVGRRIIIPVEMYEEWIKNRVEK